MKKLNFLLTIAIAAIIGFTSCSEDELTLDVPGAPTIEVAVDQIGTEFAPLTVLTFTVTATPPADGVLGQLTVTPSVDGNGGPALGSHVYNTTEVVTYTYTVPFGTASISINFEVTAVNEEDMRLESSTEYDYLFSVQTLFSENTGITLYSPWNADSTVVSMIKLEDASTYSLQQSIDGDGDLKLGIDMVSFIMIDTTDGAHDVTAIFGGTGLTRSGETPIMNLWGGYFDFRKYTTLGKFTLYNQIDYDECLPEDIFVSSTYATGVVEGDVITFETALEGGYDYSNPGVYLQRTNTPIMGAIKILEINEGTIGDGSDGYVVFDYKFFEL
jgi:hypothetical protein